MMEYFLPRIEHFIYFEIMKYLDTSVRTWPKWTGDITTDVNEAERIFYRALRRNARDIVDQWIVFSFHLDICQDISHRYSLFSILNGIFFHLVLF